MVEIAPSTIGGEVEVIKSKSILHRVMICEYLSGKRPSHELFSIDVQKTYNALGEIKGGVLDCGQSGTTLRLLACVVAGLGGDYTLKRSGRLALRPMDELVSVFSAHGVKCFQDTDFHILGKLSAGEYRIRGDISSQYISGLLFALPLLDGDSEIVLSSRLESASYVDMTIAVLKAFGISVLKTENGFFVRGGQEYKYCDYSVEGDWSNGASLLALGALSGSVTALGLTQNSIQGDRVFADILNKAGAYTKWQKGGLYVEKRPLKGFEYDFSDCPDLVPVSAALSAVAEGESRYFGVERLRLKESDRIESVMATLKAFGIKSFYQNGVLTIKGGKITKGNADGFDDHRIVMAAPILASVAGGVISGESSVAKSYPDYFEVAGKLGLKIKEN